MPDRSDPRATSDPDADPGSTEGATPKHPRGPGWLSVALESLALTSTGGVIDGFTSGQLGLWFALGFVAGSVLTAVTVRREDLLAAAVLPPLVFAASVVLTSPAVPGGSGGGLQRQLLELVSMLALMAPLLIATTGAAGLITLVRWWRSREAGSVVEPEDGQDAAGDA